MTHEEKLKAIIEAQVRGGYKEYSYIIERKWGDGPFHWLRGKHFTDPNGIRYDSILEILLDTQGLKAIFPRACVVGGVNWFIASEKIISAWHSDNGNNWEAAIDTAYDLLPQ